MMLAQEPEGIKEHVFQLLEEYMCLNDIGDDLRFQILSALPVTHHDDTVGISQLLAERATVSSNFSQTPGFDRELNRTYHKLCEASRVIRQAIAQDEYCSNGQIDPRLLCKLQLVGHARPTRPSELWFRFVTWTKRRCGTMR